MAQTCLKFVIGNGAWPIRNVRQPGQGRDINEFSMTIVGIEIGDKMTDRQIAAKVRQHFLK
jgi:hypothetical protein